MRLRSINNARGLVAASAAVIGVSFIVAAAPLAGQAARQSAPRVAPARPAPGTAKGKLYVSNETQGSVAIIDATSGSVDATIPVGKRPRGIKLSRDGTRLFVALSGSPIAGPGVDESKLPPPDRSADGIGVVDLASRKLLRTYPSGQDPETFDLSPDGRTVYVSNEDAGEMSVLDLTRGRITKRVTVCGEPEGVTVSPNGRFVYVTCEAAGEVAIVNTSTLQLVTRVKTGARPRGVAFTRDGRAAFVSNENAASLSVIDTAKHAVSGTIDLAARGVGAAQQPRPMGLVLAPDGGELFVSNGRARSVTVIDVAKRTPTRVIQDVGARPWGIAISADGKWLYTANGPSGDVSFVEVATGRVDQKAPVGGSPWGVVVSR